jgi:hypothetical protein
MLDKVKTPLTLVVLVLLVVGALGLGLRLATEDVPPIGGPQDETACENQTIQAGDKLRTSQVTINVYNAGTVSRLAEDTQAALVEKGFLPGQAGNAPAGVRASGTLVLDPEPRSAAVRLVKKQLKDPVGVRRIDVDLAEGVDVVVGDDARGVRRGGPLSVTVYRATEVCVPAPPTTS